MFQYVLGVYILCSAFYVFANINQLLKTRLSEYKSCIRIKDLIPLIQTLKCTDIETVTLRRRGRDFNNNNISKEEAFRIHI